MSKVSRIYIAGPCTGLKNFNYPAFNAEAARLRGLGYVVENPAENKAPANGAWDGYMRLAIAQLVTCDIIALLPGWINSRGATIEKRLAIDIGIHAMKASDIVIGGLKGKCDCGKRIVNSWGCCDVCIPLG